VSSAETQDFQNEAPVLGDEKHQKETNTKAIKDGEKEEEGKE